MKPLPLRVPALVPGVDVRTLPLSAVEGFVLSRIDGRSAVTEIVSMTGLGADQVGAIVEKLVSLGAARWVEESRPTPPSGAPMGTVKSAPSSSSLPPKPVSRSPSSPSQSPISAARRRGISGPPRRAMAESGISQAPPDFKPSQRPPFGSNAPRPPSKRPPDLTPPPPPPPSEEARADPVKALFDAFEDSERTSPKMERPDRLRAPEAKVTIHPGPSSPAELTAAMMDVDLPYDPTELMEDVELPVARRKEVLDLFYRLEHVDFYELLGIAYDADKKEVRAAYFGLSKVFHPDTMFRKNLGSYKAKMETVFGRLTEAYDTLGKKKAREEYDGYLQATKSAQMVERALQFETKREQARVAASEAKVSMPAAPPFASPPSAPAPERALPPREMSDEARKLAQQIMQRRLRGVMGQAPKPPVEPRPAAAVPAPANDPASGTSVFPRERTDPQELLRRLTRTLKDVGNITGTSDQLTRHVKGSQSAFARGDVAEAAKLMQKAVSLAPDREDLRAEFDRLSRMLSEKLATAYEEQARFEQKSNKWASAALSWVKVCEGKPQDANAHRQAAQALFKAGGDLRGAQKYAQQAVFLAPGDIDAHLLLAQLYMTLGLKLNAKRELDAATKLDPENEMVKNLLADMKG